MDSSKIANVDRQSQPSSIDVDFAAVLAESLANIDRSQQNLTARLALDVEEIQERSSKFFRQFLLAKEQGRMPFLQRVMTSHIENMEDERGFPPRHPVHWFKSKLEFSSTGVLEFDFQKEAELFIEAALSYIEIEIKEQLTTREKSTSASVDRLIRDLQQHLAQGIQPIAKARKIIATEYVNSFVKLDRLMLKSVDRFYFTSMGKRFNPKQELIYSEVCVRPTGMFDRRKDGETPTQLKYAISCDRLLDVVNESISRSVGQIQQQTTAYLTGELTPQIDKLLQELAP
jgi:hypothetical protein